MVNFEHGTNSGMITSLRNTLTQVCHPHLIPADLVTVAAAFYRQSLQIQQLHAELFHNATALRGINGPEDVQKMPSPQRELAIRSIHIGRQVLEITMNSPTYREGMRYGEKPIATPRNRCQPHVK